MKVIVKTFNYSKPHRHFNDFLGNQSTSVTSCIELLQGVLLLSKGPIVIDFIDLTLCWPIKLKEDLEVVGYVAIG